MRPVLAYRIAATAPNDSQKPGHSNAHGSSSTTTPSAVQSTWLMPAMRPVHSAAATTRIMYSVRWAGMPKPASSTYSTATSAPANAATFCAGSSSGNCAAVKKERRHRIAATSAARPATIVMCRPEMEIRWPTPVRLNTSQSACGMPRWSPITSATITPAYGLPASASRMRSRSSARQRSTTVPKRGTKASTRPSPAAGRT